MARQPVPARYHKTGMGMHRVVPNNTRLAGLIGHCVSAATKVEVQFALTMGALLGVENPASVAVFATLRNARARRDALIAAATHSLSDELLEIFEALVAIYEKARRPQE